MKTTFYKEHTDGIEYYRDSGMYGGGWKSRENGVQPGTVRVIDRILCHAWQIYKRGWFKKPEILWSPVDPSRLRKVELNERLPEER